MNQDNPTPSALCPSATAIHRGHGGKIMTYKQKFRYTLLGAVTMLIGMAVGVIISPPLIAQRSGGIDEIQCSKVTIVDKYGEPAIVLGITEENGTAIEIFYPDGKKGVRLSASEGGSSLGINNPSGESTFSILTSSTLTMMNMDHNNEHTGIGFRIFNGISSSIEVNTPTGKKGLELSSADQFSNVLNIYDKAGTNTIHANGHNRFIQLIDEEGDLAVTLDSDSGIGNSVNVYEKEGTIGSDLEGSEKLEWEKLAGKHFNVKAKFGKVKWSAP